MNFFRGRKLKGYFYVIIKICEAFAKIEIFFRDVPLSNRGLTAVRKIPIVQF